MHTTILAKGWRIGKRLALLAALSLPVLAIGLTAPSQAWADTAPALLGSNWVYGTGVNACSMNGYYDSTCGGDPAVGSPWQCVELAQRLYYRRGWYTANGGHFPGVGSAYQIWNKAGAMGMTTQANGHISSIVPGDMIVHGQGTSTDAGHVAVVNYIGSDGVHVVEQNYGNPGAAHTAVYGFSGGTLSRTLYDSSGHVMPIAGVVHSPNNPNTNGSSPPPAPYDPKLRAASHLSADFTGDGKPDIAVLYDYGNNDTAVLVFRNTGSGFATPSVWWDSGPGNWSRAKSKPLAGDFTGDGKPDIAIAYDYGNSDMGLLVLTNTGTSFGPVQSWYRSGPGGVNLWAAKLMAADFNGDGKPDIAALYDYGNNDTALLVFINTGSSFAPFSKWWESGVGNWAWGSSAPLVGDFNGDGKPDVMVMYDYGNSDMGLLLLPNTGSSFGPVVSWYRSGAGGVNAGAAWPIVGDFNGDGKPDVLMMYDYGNSWTQFLLFPNTGSGFSNFRAIWNSGVGNWTWGWSVPLTADFNSDGKPDVVVMYNYGNNDTGLNLLPGTGAALGSPATSWYRSGPGSFNWGAATAM